MKRMLLLLICISLSACVSLSTNDEASSGLTFVHLNDTYRVGAVEDGNAGGFSRVVTVVRELKSQGRDVRIMHGGDFLYPSLESSLWNGMQMVDAMNFMDALAPLYVVGGNHEFDRRTSKQLIEAVKASEFDWLGDNYTFRTGDADVDAALRSAFTIESDGRTIGIFALTLHADDGGNERDYVPIDKDYPAVAESVIEHFEAAGVDAIVGLTHLHMWQDDEVSRLRARHPKLTFLLGGHEHEPEHRALGNGSAAIMKGASNARTIWIVNLDFDAQGLPVLTEKQVHLNQQVSLDPDYEVLATTWRSRLLETFPFLEATVGVAALPLDGREVTLRNEESNWGSFVADQMRGAFGNPKADLAFVNGGTLRIDDFVAEDIQFEDIARTFGFSSYLRRMTISGAEFREVMEAGYRGFGPSKGYFPQVSGFRVCVDRRRNEGDRIVSLQVPASSGWAEIDDERIYSLVVPDFLYGGGDGYKLPKDRPASRPASELIYLVLDAVLDAQARGEKIGWAINKDNRRYHELLEGKEPCFQ